MSILTEIQSLSPSSLIELFVLDMRNLQGGGVSYFHSGTNGLMQSVVWQGNSYSPLPLEATGFDMTTKGALPRPRIRVANVNGMFSSLVAANSDLIGCKVTRKRTFAKYLDAVNFASGINPTSDVTQFLPDELWVVDLKVNENKYIVEWELSSSLDVQGVQLPFRQIIQNSCSWAYRGPQCNYVGTAYFDTNDNSCSKLLDTCSKRLSSCNLRFPNGSLPYGGFPGALLYGQ